MMMPYPGGHAAYRKFVTENLRKHYPNHRNRLDQKTVDIIDRFLSLDLDFVDALMAPRYSPLGRLSRTPSCMLRTILLSIEFKVETLSGWSAALKSNRLYAILSGFSPGDTPGTGTFYDFYTRLWLSDSDNLSSHIRQKSPSVIKPARKGDKAEPVEKMTVEELLGHYRNNPVDPESLPFKLLFDIFKKGFLDHSAANGIFCLERLVLAGDGTPVYTSARERSHGLDDKTLKAHPEWDGLRYYSQPDCNIGWDSSRNTFYHGYDMYLFTAADSKSNLPVFPLLDPASMHDSIGFVHALMAMKALLPECAIDRLLLDSAHDNMATYRYCQENHITPFIDLNLKGMKTFEANGITFSAADSRPVCMAGLKLTRDGVEKKRGRIKYRCPYAWSDIHKCGRCGECCSSEYGKVIHVATEDNPRFFCVPARGSKEWKEEYNARTSAERGNKQFKNDRKLEGGRHRSTKNWYCRLYMIAMCIHLDSWDPVPTDEHIT